MRRFAPYAFHLCVAVWLGVMAGKGIADERERRLAEFYASLSVEELSQVRI